MASNDPICAAVILAAGSSSRLGAPKQLLMYNDKPLIQHAVDEATAAGLDRIIVVTGAVEIDVLPPNVMLVKNEAWQEGMASSIREGINAMQGIPDIGAAIIMVCDQPYADRHVLRGLVEAYRQSGQPIVASAYEQRAGTPALFDRSIFPLLMELKGDVGARHLIAANKEQAVFVGFPKGITDIDTLSDYERVLKEIKKA